MQHNLILILVLIQSLLCMGKKVRNKSWTLLCALWAKVCGHLMITLICARPRRVSDKRKNRLNKIIFYIISYLYTAAEQVSIMRQFMAEQPFSPSEKNKQTIMNMSLITSLQKCHRIQILSGVFRLSV